MLKDLDKKLVEMHNKAFAGTRINSKISDDLLERQNACNYETRLNDASVCLEYIKEVNEKLEKRIANLEEIRTAAEKSNVEFRYISELEFLKELRG